MVTSASGRGSQCPPTLEGAMKELVEQPVWKHVIIGVSDVILR